VTKFYRTIDLVTIATLGVAFGVIFWGWDKAYEPVSTALTVIHPTTVGVVGGLWLIAGVVGGLVVGKPGAALATELIAASMELVLPGGNQWGFSALTSGLLQGLGAELVFAAFLYRRFSLPVAALAGIVAAVFEWIYEWNFYWTEWDVAYKVIYLGFFAVSGAVIAGLGGWLLVRALGRAGVLDAFPAGRELAGEV
jgi:energy-coupling factor transport system substrate-specific component